MASIAMMIRGAVLNSAAFTSGNFLAKYFVRQQRKGCIRRENAA